MSEAVLRVEHLTTRLKIGKHLFTAVENLSFELYSGKTLALVGESGCGKTLAALSLLRLTPQPPSAPSSGAVWYKGENLLTVSEARLRKLRGSAIAMIFQDPTNALNPVYTIGSQMVEVIELHMQIFGEEARARAALALERVGIATPGRCLDDYPHQLSGGMRQRVMIAMALLCEPDILIADEPTTALDVTIQAQVLNLMRALQRERGMALLLITHDMGVVAEMADEVIVMYAAQGVEYSAVDPLFDAPSHPYTQGLFASRPTLQQKTILHPIPGAVPPLGAFPSGCHFHPRCPYVMEKCRTGFVPIFTTPIGQRSRCWLHESADAGVEAVDE